VTAELTEEVDGLSVRDFLKHRASENDVFQQIVQLASEAVDLLLAQDVEANLGPPKANLTEADGCLSFRTPTTAASEAMKLMQVHLPCNLHYENFVPRGCVLRNVPYILSMAAYLGPDTKTRLNSAPTKAKVSNMQVRLNLGVQGLVAALICFSIYVAVLADIVEGGEGPSSWPESVPSVLVRFIVYVIILYQIVPISLLVFFEIIKLILGYQIGQDPQMVDPRTGEPALARTADLVEEMGQVNFVFSDKTGTLTENEMVFARCCIGGEDLGDFRNTEDGQLPCGVAKARRILEATDSERHDAVRWFFLCMATCHTAQVEAPHVGCSTYSYSGSSPDEVAFLDSAREVGITFESRRLVPGKPGWELHVRSAFSPGNLLVFETLVEIPFDSDRKRMSVICRHNGKLYLIVKGADSVIQSLCKRPFPPKDVEYLSKYSWSGLRTLAFAARELDQAFFETWCIQWTSAQGREDVERVAALIEHSFDLVGISAIEDRLQEGVPEAITTIKAAGIRFWVLTGDKTETAVEIVRACHLFTEDMMLVSLVNCRSIDHAMELLEDGRLALARNRKPSGLVIDGTFVTFVLQARAGPARLYNLALQSRACVSCRLSPNQKQKLVELVRNHDRTGITLAIGDGANDVSMLQGAHIGIGIRGKEGNQAVQASDVAISQFRFLVPLLLCHGRRAYRRVAVFLCYVLYKHISLATGDVVWAHYCTWRFGGQFAYPEWLSASFPALITGLPMIVLLGFDKDLPDEVVLKTPDLYMEGINRIHFNYQVFVTWVITAIWHGSVAWSVPSVWVGSYSWEAHTPPHYEPREFWAASCVSFVMVIVFLNVRLWLYTYSPFSKPTLLVMAFSFLVLIVIMFGLSHTTPGHLMQPQVQGVAAEIFSTGKYLLVMAVTPLVLVVDAIAIRVSARKWPTPLDTARRRWAQGDFESETVDDSDEGAAHVDDSDEGAKIVAVECDTSATSAADASGGR